MTNPFVFDRPNNINVKDFINFYIKDNIYTRFLESTRNIIIIGVRGSGKTSTLRYYSFPVQFENPEYKNKYAIIGVHIPSKNPLFGKREYLLYENVVKQYIVVEHFLSLNIISCICDTFARLEDNLSISQNVKSLLINNLSFIFDTVIIDQKSIFSSIKLFTNKELLTSQRNLINKNFESFVDFAFSFENTVVPFLEQLAHIPELAESHYSLLFDDVQDLGEIHKKILNSWIAYRDNKLFSFKIATADIKPNFVTSTGGLILEGHDFVKIDLAKRLFNKSSEFSKFAQDVIIKRLSLVNTGKSVDEFLPISESFKEGLEEGRNEARKIAIKKFPQQTGTQINDYVAKHGRAIYFRNRNPKSNLPAYSGFETIVDISTGVIRNLLTPIYFMYEKELSNTGQNNVNLIPHSVQREVILKRSQDFWEKINEIDSEIENCTMELTQKIKNFFTQLMHYLRKRLKNTDISEPRALNFIISNVSTGYEQQEIEEIINISLRSTLLYQRLVSHKATGQKLPLYVPNRLMLPAFGLDPHGQYSHFPIKAKHFLEAANLNKPLPLFTDIEEDDSQLEIEF